MAPRSAVFYFVNNEHYDHEARQLDYRMRLFTMFFQQLNCWKNLLLCPPVLPSSAFPAHQAITDQFAPQSGGVFVKMG